MKVVISSMLVAAVMILGVSCSKKTTGKGQTCTCKGGISGQGTTQVMDSLSHAEAEARCNNYNAIVGPDAYYDCHLE